MKIQTTSWSQSNGREILQKSPQGESEQEPPAQLNLVEWWYRLTAPTQPSATAPLRQREAARRGRLASTTLIFMSLITAMALPIAFVAHS
ncbi:MAG: hypothetical protein JO125_12340, partial [Chloroflexi bacterium]|nr:hypothetical protein [Chloroflexota bacterium]